MKLVTLVWIELYKQKKGWIWLFLRNHSDRHHFSDVFGFHDPL